MRILASVSIELGDGLGHSQQSGVAHFQDGMDGHARIIEASGHLCSAPRSGSNHLYPGSSFIASADSLDSLDSQGKPGSRNHRNNAAEREPQLLVQVRHTREVAPGKPQRDGVPGVPLRSLKARPTGWLLQAVQVNEPMLSGAASSRLS